MIGTNVIERCHLHPHLEMRRKNNDVTLTMKRNTTAVANTADVDTVDDCG